MADAFDKTQVVVGEVEVRLARCDERRRWDALMDRHHYLGFRQFAGRGLRHVAVWCGWWLALLGWQSGAFKCAPRDRWLGWHRSVQFRRLHLIGNNTRFLILPEALGIANLASRVLGRSVRRVSADWESAYGHPLELAETFVDPNRFHGGAYDASNWVRVGRTKGFARHNGAYTDPHEQPKEMFVLPLRADARARLADPTDREEWTCRATPVSYTREELRSLRSLFAEMPDCRRGQGRKHKLATVLSVCALARLAGVSGPAATERFAKYLSQEELRALGAWRDPVAGRWVAPSDSTLCRVMADTDPDALGEVLRRWAAPRAVPKGTPPALAADGKRIRGANRHTGEGVYFETVTLVTHEGRPLASRCCRDEGGELAATKALLDDVDVRGCLVTLDALHTTYETERALVDIHRADYLFTVRAIAPRPSPHSPRSTGTHRGCVITAPRPRRATGAWTGVNSTPSPCLGGCCASTRRAKQCVSSASAPSCAPARPPPRPSTPSPRSAPSAPTPNNSSPGIVAIGWSRTPTTIAATPPSARTRAASAPDTPPRTTPP